MMESKISADRLINVKICVIYILAYIKCSKYSKYLIITDFPYTSTGADEIVFLMIHVK